MPGALYLAGLLLVAFPVAALEPAQLDQLRRLIHAEMARQRIPGLTVAVAHQGQLVWTEGFGFADLEHQVPATERTVYRLASLAKPITAVAVLQLAEAGQLDLDAPVQRYVPSFPQKPWPITPRLLLGHLAGIRHYRSMEELHNTRHYTSLLAALEQFKDDPLVSPPGVRFVYSTYGYVLLGAIVEAASRQSFAAYLQQHIFAPAGMRDTQVDDVYRLIPRRARGYRLNATGEIENCVWADNSNKIPGGGLVGTAADLVRFALSVRNGTLLKPETVEQMWTRQRLRNGQLTHYGLGWSIEDWAGQRTVGHSGGQPGVSTGLIMLPEPGIVVVVLANLERAHLAPIFTGALKVLTLSTTR